jgi:hypothetical protein
VDTQIEFVDCPVTRRKAVPPPGRWRMLGEALTALASAAIAVLAAVVLGLSRGSGDGRVPHPEPAPAPVPQ